MQKELSRPEANKDRGDGRNRRQLPVLNQQDRCIIENGEGGAYKYRFRQLAVDWCVSILNQLATGDGAQASEFFGKWAEWGGDSEDDRTNRPSDDIPNIASEPWTDASIITRAVVNITNLRRYAQ